MTYLEDLDAVRDYIRTTGRADFVRLREVASGRAELVFSGDVEHHTQAIAKLVSDPTHIRVLAGPLRDHRRHELAEQYWGPHRETVLAAWEGHGVIRQLSFSYDDEGPYLALGLLPCDTATIAEAVAVFAPHRIVPHEGADTVTA